MYHCVSKSDNKNGYKILILTFIKSFFFLNTLILISLTIVKAVIYCQGFLDTQKCFQQLH